MKMRQFIRENREEITKIIQKKCPNLTTMNDEDRQQWVLNDEGLYHWARKSGVPC